MKVSYYELPTNVRIAIIPLWAGMVSFFFYSLAINFSTQKCLDIPSPTTFNFGFYIAAFFLLKRKSRSTFITTLTVLFASTIYGFYEVFKNFDNQAEPLALSVWWPAINAGVFTICCVLIALPQLWKYYNSKQ